MGSLSPHRIEADAGIAQLHLERGAAVPGIHRVREVGGVEGDLPDEAVDLVEGQGVARPRVGGQRAGAEADHGHAPGAAAPIQLGEELPDRAAEMIVRDRLGAPRGLEALPAVQRGAVAQLGVALLVPVAQDPEDAEEAPALADLIAVPGIHEARHHQHSGERGAQGQGVPPQEERHDERRPVYQELVQR